MPLQTGESMGKQHVRNNLFLAQDGLCFWCRHQMTMRLGCEATATIDHLTPRADGGDNSRGNLVGSCHRCNQLRGLMPWQAFLAWVQVETLPPPKFITHSPKNVRRRMAKKVSAKDLGIDSPGGWKKTMPRAQPQPIKSIATLADIWPNEW